MKKTLSILLSFIMVISAVCTLSLSAFGASSKTVSGTFNYSYASQVLTLVNKERASNGLKALTMTQSLTDGAMIRAAETTVSFSHTRPNGEQCFTAFKWTSAAGENIAYGQRTPEQVVNGWMNSSGHRANILSSSFTTIGIGCFEYNGTYYWSQAFSGGSGSSYSPSGSKAATVEVSLTSGVQSKVVSLGGSSASTTAKTTTKATTKATSKATTKATTKSTTKKHTTTKKKTTTKKQTTTKKKTTTKKQTTKCNTTSCKSDCTSSCKSDCTSSCKSNCTSVYVNICGNGGCDGKSVYDLINELFNSCKNK